MPRQLWGHLELEPSAKSSCQTMSVWAWWMSGTWLVSRTLYLMSDIHIVPNVSIWNQHIRYPYEISLISAKTRCYVSICRYYLAYCIWYQILTFDIGWKGASSLSIRPCHGIEGSFIRYRQEHSISGRILSGKERQIWISGQISKVLNRYWIQAFNIEVFLCLS